MSAPIKRKIISLELPKAKVILKNRLSVFKRLGYKRERGQPVPTQYIDTENSNITSKIAGSTDLIEGTPKSVSQDSIISRCSNKTEKIWAKTKLDDEEPHLLEKRRQELQKELEKQLKMESSKRREIRKLKLKKGIPSSSSDSSTSSSGSNSSSDESSSSSSTTSKESRRKIKKRNLNKRRSSSSPDTSQHCKKTMKKHSHSKKVRDDHIRKTLLKRSITSTTKVRLKTGSPNTRKPRSISPLHKLEVKPKISAKKDKHLHDDLHERRERDILKDRERMREREKIRIREREKIKSRSPKAKLLARSRSPRLRSPQRNRELKKKSPDRRVSSPLTPTSKYRSNNPVFRRERSDERNMVRPSNKDATRRQETPKDRERREREAARDKERAEALARCQERQRERERIAREKMRRIEHDEFSDRGHKQIGRLIPHPSDRARALAVASRSTEKSLERERIRSRSPHSPRNRNLRNRNERIGSYEKHDRNYLIHQPRSRDRELKSPEHEFIGAGRSRVDSPYGRDHHDNDYEGGYDNHLRNNDERLFTAESYNSSREYPDEHNNRRERNWIRNDDHHEELAGRNYERSNIIHDTARDWDRSPREQSDQEVYSESKRDWQESTKQWSESDNWAKNDKHSNDWMKYGGAKDSRQWNEIPHRDEHIPPTNSISNNSSGNRKWTNTEWHGSKSQLALPSNKEDHTDYGRAHHQAPVTTPTTTMIQNETLHHSQQRPIYRRSHPHHPHHNTHSHHSIHTQQHQHPNTIYHPRKPHVSHQNSPQLGSLRFHHPNQHIYHKRNYVNTNHTPQTGLKPTTTVISTSNFVQVDDQNQKASTVTEATITSLPKSDSNTICNMGPEADVIEEEIIAETNEDNLSEISEEADEILTRDDENVEQKSEVQLKSQDCIPEPTIDIQSKLEVEQTVNCPEIKQPDDRKNYGKDNANKELKEEMDLDFEEISDGELEEEMKFKGLGDALGVDWASLVEETRKPIINEPVFPNSARKRWQSHRILLDIGISVKMAGKKFAEKTIKDAHRLLEEEKLQSIELMGLKTEKLEDTIKEELISVNSPENDVTANEPLKTVVKVEVLEENEKNENSEIPILHPAAVIQVALREQKLARKNIILNATGSFSRALSARGDLHVRRHLCNFPISADFEKSEQPVNNELLQTAKQLFLRKIKLTG